MLESLTQLLVSIDDFVWGVPLMVLILAGGIWLTLRARCLQVRRLPLALKWMVKNEEGGSGEVTSFAALCTALSATIGTGNIVGVATAMVLGGPGALVWMWISAAFGLSTKYGESVLAVKYRETNSIGEMSGGPMYAMRNGIGGTVGKVMGVMFAFFAATASFGIGNMTQANAMAAALESGFFVPTWITGAVVMVASLIVLTRGIRSIGAVSGVVVPAMSVFYFCMTLIVIECSVLMMGTLTIWVRSGSKKPCTALAMPLT